MEALPQTPVKLETRARFSVGILLARWLVPLYFFLGAVFKLIDASPSDLPAALIKLAGWANVDLLYILRLSIASELAVAGVMIILPRLGRVVGLLLLGLFLPILIGDLLLGASSCGCFGAVAIPPWVTLLMDGGLFVGLWYFGAADERLAWKAEVSSRRVLVAGFWTVAVFMLGFVVGGGSQLSDITPPDQVSESVALPAEGYFLPDYDAWIGKSWQEMPLASWIRGVPSDWGRGLEYVLLYRKDCDHCHDLMEVYFSDVLPAPVLAVAVPEKSGFPTENVQPFPCGECQLAELPAGIDWFFQTPVLIRLENGVVACAAEINVDDPQCLEN